MIKLRNLFCFILTIVCFWYQISGTRNPATGTRNWYQILVSISWALDFRRRHVLLWKWKLHLESSLLWLLVTFQKVTCCNHCYMFKVTRFFLARNF